MSTSVPGLLRALVDDAAVFPPGDSPLPAAVCGHGEHRAAWYTEAVGPLLVPAAAAGELLEQLDAGRWTGPGALRVAVVARPGTDPAVLDEGLAVLGADHRVEVAGAELGWSAGWRRLGIPGEVPLALEVPRGGADQAEALADIRASVAEGDDVVAKFRTGPTPTWPWPDEDELAAFLHAATASPVPFKLTGGLHHAVRGAYEVGGDLEENHGVLNVLAATAAALDAAPREELTGILATRDTGALVATVGGWAPATGERVRRALTSFGCCTVTDPVGELVDLGLLTAP
jgi:hypothetical protein